MMISHLSRRKVDSISPFVQHLAWTEQKGKLKIDPPVWMARVSCLFFSLPNVEQLYIYVCACMCINQAYTDEGQMMMMVVVDDLFGWMLLLSI